MIRLSGVLLALFLSGPTSESPVADAAQRGDLRGEAGDARVALPEAEESQTGVVVPTALGLSEKDAAGAAQDVSEKKGL